MKGEEIQMMPEGFEVLVQLLYLDEQNLIHGDDDGRKRDEEDRNIS